MKKDYKEIAVKTTYMQMLSEPKFDFPERKWTSLTHFQEPNINFYKEIYKRVGKNWGWTGRLFLSDEQLKQKLHSPNNELFALFEKENFVGFFELDKQLPESVEIVYLGVVPEYIGKGFGSLLLKLAITKAWQFKPERVWLHTCEHDHKNAIKIYQKYGFQTYKTSVDFELYPISFLKKNNIDY